jgi:DNA topoisomerase-2
MVAFDENGTLKKYESTDHIIDNFCKVRYDFYVRRKVAKLKELDQLLKMLGNKKRFLQEVRDGEIKLFNEKKGGKKESKSTNEIVLELEKRKYDMVVEENNTENDTNEDDNMEEDEKENKTTDRKKGYSYLLRLQISSITAEKINKLEKDIANKQSERDTLFNSSERDIWIRELDELEAAYEKWLPKLNSELKQIKNKK